MKKIISIITIIILVSSFMTACTSPPKDADYLYEWLSEHGTLVDGTCLQYSGTDENGAKFLLCYDTNYVDNLRWRVEYSTIDILGHTINTQLFLFYDDTKAVSRIYVYGSGTFDDYYCGREYSHKPEKFTKNSPIEEEDYLGSTVNINEVGKDVLSEIYNMNTVCESCAQKNLCMILDWLKNSFCPTAKMSMSDFGYKNY